MQVSQIENQICIVEIPINLERLVDLLPREGQGNLRDAVGLDAFFVEEKMPKSRRTMSHHYNEIEAKKQHSKLVRGGNLKVSPIVTEGIAHNELSQSPLSPVSRTDDTDLEAVNVELNTPHNPHNLYVRSLLFVLDVQFREDSDPVLRVASCNTAVKPALVIAHEGKP
jgi:hypothetical protein